MVKFKALGCNDLRIRKLELDKVIMQGKLFQRCTHLLYCGVLCLGGNVNTRRMSQPDMGPIFHIKNQWNILVIGNYYVNYQNYKNQKLLSFSDIIHWCIFSCLQSQPRENWFQYVRREYTTAINFPCITSLVSTIKIKNKNFS